MYPPYGKKLPIISTVCVFTSVDLIEATVDDFFFKQKFTKLLNIFPFTN